MIQKNYQKPILSVIRIMPRNSFLASSPFGDDGAAGNVFNDGNTNYYEDL